MSCFFKECIPDLLETLRTAQFEGLQLNCLNTLINLSVLEQNHPYFHDDGVYALFSKFDVISQSTDTEKFHALKVVVNLSCCDETVPRLLNTKVIVEAVELPYVPEFQLPFCCTFFYMFY